MWVREFVGKYIEKAKMMREIKLKNYVYMMDAAEVIRATMLLNLLSAVLQEFHGETMDRPCYEKIFIYALSWAMGGLFEVEDRVRFHKEILEKNGAPLP